MVLTDMPPRNGNGTVDNLRELWLLLHFLVPDVFTADTAERYICSLGTLQIIFTKIIVSLVEVCTFVAMYREYTTTACRMNKNVEWTNMVGKTATPCCRFIDRYACCATWSALAGGCCCCCCCSPVDNSAFLFYIRFRLHIWAGFAAKLVIFIAPYLIGRKSVYGMYATWLGIYLKTPTE